MPESFLCFSLKTGSNIIGVFQWVGVGAAITLLVMHLAGALVSTKPWELPVMLLVANVVPAFAWFA